MVNQFYTGFSPQRGMILTPAFAASLNRYYRRGTATDSSSREYDRNGLKYDPRAHVGDSLGAFRAYLEDARRRYPDAKINVDASVGAGDTRSRGARRAIGHDGRAMTDRQILEAEAAASRGRF
jgi:hypothetical protein